MAHKASLYRAAVLALALTCINGVAKADDGKGNNGCKNPANQSALRAALAAATATETSGLNNQMWATIVDRDGIVCAVAFSGVNRGARWPGSRVISAQKANTANAFSLDASSSRNGSGQPSGLALSTANLYSAVQPGGSLTVCKPAIRCTPPSLTTSLPRSTALHRTRWSAARSEG